MLDPVPQSYDYDPPTEPWLSVVYVDDDILVLDKPSGLLSVAGKDPALADCLAARAAAKFPGARIVHRLDKDTSGVIVLGLSRRAISGLGIQFEKRQTRKAYVARVWGEIEGDAGRVDLPLATDWENKPRQRVDFENGRPAQTDWRVIDREPGITRVALVPRTGRTHQLRVHMLALGHPILGDAFYATGAARDAAPRLQLHAEELSFAHPADGRMRDFIVPAPF
ncbi:MAG TPA: pseudouridine synthase [Devosia sp.]|nr:pseudouridine synthase [Devosia sp.]